MKGTKNTLPAIRINVINLDNHVWSRLRVSTTIPKADMFSYALAYKIMASLCQLFGEHESSNKSLATPLGYATPGGRGEPEIERGRLSTCVLVNVTCGSTDIANEIVKHVARIARKAAKDDRGRSTHRVVTTKI